MIINSRLLNATITNYDEYKMPQGNKFYIDKTCALSQCTFSYDVDI